MNSSEVISTISDERTDVCSKQELSICGRWLENGKPVEHFLGIAHAHNAEALTQHLLQFLHDKGISVTKVHEFDLMEQTQCLGRRVECKYERNIKF